MQKKIIYFFLIFCTAFSGCIPEPYFPPTEACGQPKHYGLFVLNEGIWGQNNSTLSVWDERGEEGFCGDVFQAVNGVPMGDTGNDVLMVNDTLYILMSGSGILYQIQMPGLTKIAQWKVPSGYTLQSFGISYQHKLYLTAINPSLKSGKVFVVSTATCQLTGEIPLEKYPYGIALYEDKAVVACGNYAGINEKNRKLAVINTGADIVEKYITLPLNNPGQVLVYGDTLIVNCRGDYSVNSDSNSVLLLINRQNFQLIHSVFFRGSIYRMTTAGDYLFAIRDGEDGGSPLETTTIMRMNLKNLEVDKNFLPESYFHEKKAGDYLYCLEYDKEKGQLYVGFSSSQKGYILNPYNTITGTFKTGDFPNSIFFYR